MNACPYCASGFRVEERDGVWIHPDGAMGLTGVLERDEPCRERPTLKQED